MNPIQTLIQSFGGPTAAHRAMTAAGLDYSLDIVLSWSSGRRQPRPATLAGITQALQNQKK